MQATDVSNWISEPLDELQEAKEENVQTFHPHAGRCGRAEQQFRLLSVCKFERLQMEKLADL